MLHIKLITGESYDWHIGTAFPVIEKETVLVNELYADGHELTKVKDLIKDKYGISGISHSVRGVTWKNKAARIIASNIIPTL